MVCRRHSLSDRKNEIRSARMAIRGTKPQGSVRRLRAGKIWLWNCRTGTITKTRGNLGEVGNVAEKPEDS
jgi:hypothetical protein